jgi:hypothetical protein
VPRHPLRLHSCQRGRCCHGRGFAGSPPGAPRGAPERRTRRGRGDLTLNNIIQNNNAVTQQQGTFSNRVPPNSKPATQQQGAGAAARTHRGTSG